MKKKYIMWDLMPNVGFNANNAICNESFFEGSITLYPTNEKENKISF